MSAPILTTKLYIPPPRTKIVPRQRLIERLAAGVNGKLTLISAPAGFGKTTLVSEWISACGRPVAWLSLDEGDHDSTRFLTYFIAALQTIAPNLGAGVLDALQFPQPLYSEATLVALLNEITTLPGNFIFVLDDYHLIDSKPLAASKSIDAILTFLIEHLPPQMHLVIATREDPHLPLARLRARGQLTELRAADLRFTPAEAAEFLNHVMGLNLSAQDSAALEIRTEGWIAGLQLAALSMQGHPDAASFIQSFTGSRGKGFRRFVLDYLVEEVLQQQPEHVRNFLLQSAILDRLCAPLCDALTLRQDSREMLDALERDNLFVVPLDDCASGAGARHWVRYHHLFAEVLRVHLLEEQPDLVSALHRRAGEWYEQNNLRPDAIRHALAARDFERAASLLELARPAMDLSFQSSLWLGWAKALPDELVRARPVLSFSYASALLDVGEIEAAEARLRDAERWLEPPAPGTCPEPGRGMIVVDEERFRLLPAAIAASRAYQAQSLGDIPGSVKYAELSLQLTPADDLINRIEATALLGLTYWASGDLNAADRAFADLTRNMLTSGNLIVAIGTTFVLANIRVGLGHLHAAVSAYEQVLQLAVKCEPIPVGTADLYRGMSELYCERGELEAAAQSLSRSIELGKQAASTDWLHRLCVTQARMKQIQGDLDGALGLLDEAERMFVRAPLPDVRPIAAAKARIWVAQGKLNQALNWARERGLTPDADLSYLKEFEQITLARILIARYQHDRAAASLHQALGLLQRLLQAAQAGERAGSVIEILVLQALAYYAQNDFAPALASLERAFTLAEPEGYVRIFVDEGMPMARLLRDAAQQGIAPQYVDQILAAFGKPEDEIPGTQLLIEQEVRSAKTMLTEPEVRSAKTMLTEPEVRSAKTMLTEPEVRSAKTMLTEPLSQRELEVLRLLRSQLSGPEIADQLIVSINTFRTHTNNIFSKLGVNTRRAAVRRAEELDLF
jgi:LuxR family transcriptional regulator, maltose regulon positive regulatory protein